MNLLKLVLLALVIATVAAWFLLGLGQQLSLDGLRQMRAELLQWRSEQPVLLSVAYLLAVSAACALPLPAGALSSIAGGAVFGFWLGLPLASFGTTLGALLSFLMARYLFRDVVQQRLARRMAAINRGIERDGAWYLVSLRLLTVLPPLVLNPAMGLTRMKAGTYYFATQLGGVPATVIYVYAGTQLAQLQSLQDVLSPSMLAALMLLAALTLGTRWLLKARRRRDGR